MLQATVERTMRLPEASEPLIVCNESHRFLVAEQMLEMDVQSRGIILEPAGRNTAPAAAVAALFALREDPDAVLLILPADHVIADDAVFAQTVASGLEAAKQGWLITFGVKPAKPETGYGYIRAGEPIPGVQGVNMVERFVEKPDAENAARYVESGDYYWNSGMFLVRADAYLRELDAFCPDMRQFSEQALEDAVVDLDFLRLAKAPFSSCPSDSIDYAVMEKTTKAAVAPLAAGWNDVGSWGSLLEVGEADKHGNVSRGDVVLHDVENSYLHSTGRLIAAVGLRNVVVVETKDALLVADASSSQNVKDIVEKLGAGDREEVNLHSKVYRPWGSYETIDMEDRFQVKRLTVKPGQVLSLQMHHHRAEHWVVVKGTAKVTKNEEEIILHEDQSIYLPLGTTHRLENPGKIMLELIEVQTGSYLGEDDIVRFEDVYGRTEK
jgi:mannose-1-phosphate guanylyltransferase/mannose-6-phosphate isomerase